MPITFPSQILLKNLKGTARDLGPYLTREDLFEGGERFEKNKSKYLIKRHVEEKFPDEYKERMNRSNYANYYASIIRWWADAVVSDPPIIVESEQLDYLNHDLTELSHDVMIQALLHRCAWMRICFEPEVPVFESISASSVDDYQYEPNGDLLYVRTFGQLAERPDPFTPPQIVYNVWTYTTKDQIVAYRIDEKKTGDDEIATKFMDEKHGLDMIPYFKLELPMGLQLGQILLRPALQIYNQESNLDWLLAKQAFSLLVLKTKRPIKDMIAAETSAITLDPGDDAGFVSPDSSQAATIAERLESLKQQMFLLAIQSAVAATGNNSLASGESKRRDYASTEIPLKFMQAALIKTLREAVMAVAKYQNVEVPDIEGLDNVDLANKDERFEKLSKLFTLPITEENKAKVEVELMEVSGVQDLADLREDLEEGKSEDEDEEEEGIVTTSIVKEKEKK